MLYHIVAMANNRVIGKDNKLPWHFPADLKHFKELTVGSTVIMGRKTFESIGKPLPQRENIVLSRTRRSDLPQVHFFASFEEALRNVKTENAYVIGGAELYRQTTDQIDGIYLTRIERDYEGDAFYPEIPCDFKGKEVKLLQEKDPTVKVLFYKKIFRGIGS